MAIPPIPAHLALHIVTPDRAVTHEQVDEVEIPGVDGYFGVLPGHAAMIAALKVGEVMYRIGKVEHYLVLSGGLCEVADDVVTVMAEFAQLPHEIDVAAAEREQAEAEAMLPGARDEELKVALAQIETAVTRIQVAARPR